MRVSITKRTFRQKNREGKLFVYEGYALNYNDPATGKRRTKRFKTRKEAEAFAATLIKKADTLKRGAGGKAPTLQEAVDYWLASKEDVIQKVTLHAYTQVARDYILGPTFEGTQYQKSVYAQTGLLPEGVKLVPMLEGSRRIDEISTSDIRLWLQRLLKITSTYNVRLARKHLSSIFRMAEEDFELRLARMPSRAVPPHRRAQRQLLTEAQVKLVLEEAERDEKWGVYYAFLFLTGVRPSEMLGLLWNEVNLEQGYVTICRTQHPDATLKEFPKTEAGVRQVPLNSHLRQMLVDWRERCPRHDGKLHRVFPAQGGVHCRGRNCNPDSDGGLTLSNFRNRVWYKLLKRLGLPRVSLYAARHMVISYLQAQGVEVGLVAKIVGHSSPQITLQYYTHAVREQADMMDKLNAAYRIEDQTSINPTQVQS